MAAPATFAYTVDGSGLNHFNRDTAVNNPTTNVPFSFTVRSSAQVRPGDRTGRLDAHEHRLPANGAVITIGTGTGTGAGARLRSRRHQRPSGHRRGGHPDLRLHEHQAASLDIEKESVGGTGTFAYTVDGSGLR